MASNSLYPNVQPIPLNQLQRYLMESSAIQGNNFKDSDITRNAQRISERSKRLVNERTRTTQNQFVRVFRNLREYLRSYYGAQDVQLQPLRFKIIYETGSYILTYTEAARRIPAYYTMRSSQELINKMGKQNRSINDPYHTLVQMGQNIARMRRLGCKYMALRTGPRKCSGDTGEEYRYSIRQTKKFMQVVDTYSNNQVVWQQPYLRYTCRNRRSNTDDEPDCQWGPQLPKGRAVFIAKRVIDRLLGNDNLALLLRKTGTRGRSSNRPQSLPLTSEQVRQLGNFPNVRTQTPGNATRNLSSNELANIPNITSNNLRKYNEMNPPGDNPNPNMPNSIPFSSTNLNEMMKKVNEMYPPGDNPTQRRNNNNNGKKASSKGTIANTSSNNNKGKKASSKGKRS